MKFMKYYLLMAFGWLLSNMLVAQNLPLPKEAKLNTGEFTVPYAEVFPNPEEDGIRLTLGSNTSWPTTLGFRRLHDNVFAEFDKFFFVRPDGDILVLMPNDVIVYFEIHMYKEPGLFRTITMAPTAELRKAAKESVKEVREAFDLVQHYQLVDAGNKKIKSDLRAEEDARQAELERQKAEREAMAKAEAEAKAKAIAERDAALATYDFCTPLNKYAALIPSRFKSLKGKVLPGDDMYDKADTTFEATEKLQYFDIAKVQTRHKSYNNATDLDFYMKLSSKEEVAEKFTIMQNRFKACFTEKGGWFMNNIGESCSWVKGKATITLRQYNNTWDDDGGNFLHVQVSPK